MCGLWEVWQQDVGPSGSCWLWCGVSVQQACSGTSSECLIGSSLEELTPV